MTAASTSVSGISAAPTVIPDRLFIFELANNHMGDIEHGLQVVREFAKIAAEFPFKFALKLQYRDLDTFIHPDFQGRTDIKYIKRFSETRLSRSDTLRLVEVIRTHGLIPICTAFDEPSVDRVIEDGFAILKIGSCSLTDWPLLERVGSANLPIIASTGGASVSEIDSVVAFMQNRSKEFALMHCVAEYPTSGDHLQLNQIDFLRQRYPGLPIGYSTHESPTETLPVTMAIAKGCTIFEKHVGLPTEKYALNDYSASPEQVRGWLSAAQRAYEVAGLSGARTEPTARERESLVALRRGAFAAHDIMPGDRITERDVFMAIPTQEGHITANDWSKYTNYYSASAIKKGDPILAGNVRSENVREKVNSIVRRVNTFLKTADVVVPAQAELEISHHYGIQSFEKYGITMITVVNRDYCKKLIVVLPGQKHPEQFHNKKEETFHILNGDLTVSLDGVERVGSRGSVITIERGVRHAFESRDGAIFEELSSTHYADDSFYTDSSIMENRDRKTILRYWSS